MDGEGKKIEIRETRLRQAFRPSNDRLIPSMGDFNATATMQAKTSLSESSLEANKVITSYFYSQTGSPS